MFIGHFAVGFAAKKAAPQVSLGTLFLAALFLDAIWPLLVLAGIERVEIAPGDTAVTPLRFVFYPYSHSLLLTLVWAVLFGAAYWGRRGSLHGALWCGLAVASHWVLDAVTHRPDLPLYPGGTQLIGFSLWNSVAGTLFVEGMIFAAALTLYLNCTTARDKTGRTALWSLVAVLLVAYIANIFGPPPPGAQAVAIVGVLGGILAIACGYWIDRHRTSTQSLILDPQS